MNSTDLSANQRNNGMDVIETMARAWIVCDPNRDETTADQIIGQSCSASVNDDEPKCVDTPLTGKPRWHWFIPRAEAMVQYLEANGFKVERANGDAA